MKKKEERKKWKGLKMGNLFVGFVALMMTCSQTVHAEEINPHCSHPLCNSLISNIRIF